MRTFLTSLVPLLLALAIPSPAAAQALSFRDAGAARWVCGGVGAEERRALESLRRPGQLELLFASTPRGAFLAGVEVEVTGSGGSVLRATAEGPTCLLELPRGTYRIAARLGGVQRTLDWRSGGPARLVFSFPAEPWDGIRATEEEKRQAREP